MYYLRSRAAVDAIKFTLNVEELLKATDGNDINSILKCLNTTNQDDKKGNEIEKQTSSKQESKMQNEEPEACINCSG